MCVCMYGTSFLCPVIQCLASNYFYKLAIVSSASIKMGVNDYECFASLDYVRELHILII